jgi:hypothetical protein
MIEIQLIRKLDTEDLKRIANGNSSEGKYAVNYSRRQRWALSPQRSPRKVGAVFGRLRFGEFAHYLIPYLPIIFQEQPE